MWIERFVNSPVTHAIELSARFAEARHLTLAENVANLDTPDYAGKRLDPRAFQASLRDALERASKASGAERSKGVALELRGNRQFLSTRDGRVQINPQTEPAENILFHDGTNASIEQLMSDAAENGLHYQLATTLLNGRYDGLLTAIRGRVR